MALLQPEIKDLAAELKGEVFAAGKKYGWDARMAKAQFNSNVSALKLLHIYGKCSCSEHFLKYEYIFCKVIEVPYSLRHLSVTKF